MKRTICAILFIAALVLFAYVFDVLLIVFAGILLAILLRASADWVHQRLPVSHGVALGLIVCAVVAVVVISLVFGARLTIEPAILAVMLAFSVSIAVVSAGVVAWQPTRVRPLDVLRYE